MSVIGGQITLGIGPTTTKSIEHLVLFGLDATPAAAVVPALTLSITLNSEQAESLTLDTEQAHAVTYGVESAQSVTLDINQNA